MANSFSIPMLRRAYLRRWLAGACTTCLAALAVQAADREPESVWDHGSNRFSIAAGGPGETGLLERLATEFAQQNDARISWYRAGSGPALQLLKQGKIGMILAHAPAAGIAPSGHWYRVAHDFMTASLRRADAERAYFLTDSSTFIVEGPALPHLKPLYRNAAGTSD